MSVPERTAELSWADKREYIRETYESLGRPPSKAECAADTPQSRHAFEAEATWPATLHRAGVPTAREVVVAALRERYHDQYPWEETIRVKARYVAERTDLSGAWVGRVLEELDGTTTEGIHVERRETGGGVYWWEVSKP